MLRPFAAAATFALAALPSAAPRLLAAQDAPVTVTFAEYASPTVTDYQATLGAPLTSQGFDFYQAFPLAGSRNVLSTWGTSDVTAGNRASNRGASVGMFASVPGVGIDIYVAGDDPIVPARSFNMYAVDVAHLFATPTVPVLENFDLSFAAFTQDGDLISQTFTVFAPPVIAGLQTPLFQTLRFDTRWRSVTNVFWNQNGSFLSQQHQFTNVVAQVTPEPGTWALLGVGLAGVLVVAGRRRTA